MPLYIVERNSPRLTFNGLIVAQLARVEEAVDLPAPTSDQS